MLFAKAFLGLAALVGATALPAVAGIAKAPERAKVAKMAAAEDAPLFSENFDAPIEAGWGSNFTIQDGMGLINTGDMFDIPFQTVDSNNYEIEFDLKAVGDSASNFFIHLGGLDGDGGNVFLGIEGNGAYWNFRTQRNPSGEVYNNSGDFYGGLDWHGANLQEGTRVKIVHHDGYVESYLNGKRNAVAHLSEFGGTQYQSYNRINVPEGKITHLTVHSPSGSSLLMDNFTIREAKTKTGVYRETNPNNDKWSILNACAEELNYDSFQIVTRFRTDNIETRETYPAIKLVGLNGGLFPHNVENAVNIQFHDDNATLTPQLFTHNGPSNDAWASAFADPITTAVDQEFLYTIEVNGDSIKTYFDDTLCINTSFTELGITKGHLEYIMVRPGDSGYSWTEAIYQGFTAASGASVVADRATYTTGATVKATAYKFGDHSQEYSWYVDGTDTGITDVNFAKALEAGTHTLTYKNDTYTSNEAKVEVTQGIINIAADKTTGYTDSSFTFTADYEGDFTGMTTQWYVDDVAVEGVTGETATIEGLDVGTHTVYAMAGALKSNVVTLTIKEPTLVISSEKASYSREDTAVVTAEAFGLGEDITYKWFLNGTEATGQTGDTLTVDMSSYKDGEQIIVKCQVDEVISNDFFLTIYYDIAETLTSDPTYEILNDFKIVEGGDYGSYLVGSDEDGNYLYAAPDTIGPNCMIQGNLPRKSAYTYEYSLYIPADIPDDMSYYVYPCLNGANSKYPNAAIEVAFEITKKGMRPYIKDNGSNTNYDDASGSVIADCSYEKGIAKLGEWNHIIFSVQNKSVAMSLNDTPVLFFTLPSITVPTGLSMNWWSSQDGRNVPLRVKDIKTGGLVDPPSPLESISVSVNAAEIDLGETITANALINPFDAAVDSYDWYVNDVLQEGHTKTLTFTPNAAGTYEIYCKVGDIVSAKKTVTVKAIVNETDDVNVGLIVGLSVGGVAVAAGVGTLVWFLARKKKK